MGIENRIQELEAELQRKEKENEQLKKDLAFREKILACIQDSIMVHDAHGHWVYVNKAAHETRGYSEEELMQIPLSSLDTPEFAKNIPERIERLKREGSIFFETEHYQKDNSRLQLEVHSTIIELDGKDYVISDARDISLRKGTENTLAAINNTVDSAILLVDENGIINYANQKTSEMFGKPLNDIIGSPYPRYVEETHRQVAEEGMFALLRGEMESVSTERLYQRNDGSTFWGHLSGNRFESKNRNNLVGVIHDVTERKKMEIRLKEIYSNMRKLIEESPDTIVVHNMDGIIESANSAGYQLLGVNEDAIGKNIVEFIAAEDRTQIVDYVASRIRGEDVPTTYSAKLLAKDGEKIPVEISGTAIRISGEKKAVAYIKDMRSRVAAEVKAKELERELQQSQKMEALGTLTGGIAHDFNNLLSIIIGNAELVYDEVPAHNSGRYNLEQITAAGKRASDIIKQLLIFSRPGTEEKTTTDMYRLIRECDKLLRASIPTTIEIYYDQPSEPMMVEANPVQISQVLVNLSSNAMHAMEERGGVLEYRLDKEQAKDWMEPGEYVKLTVIDTGEGIAKENLEKIFDPYFTTKGVGKGSGIGLSVVKGIIEGHGGYIDVDSSPGKGTEFHIYLSSVEQVVEQTMQTSEIPYGKESILVVDDRAHIADMLTKQLESLGYSATKRTSSIEALEAFKANPKRYDLLLTDVTMPNMEGHKLAHEIRKIREDIPVILHTGYNAKISSEQAEELGYAYLQKPASRSDLANIVRNELDNIKE
ncbi:MAG: PAS domain S-box protein [Candidatus Woesearchaeota archaeon]